MDKSICLTDWCANYNKVFDFPHGDMSWCFECNTEMETTHSPECADMIRCSECGVYFPSEVYEREHKHEEIFDA